MKLLNSQAMSQRMKEQLYTSLLRPVILYELETWPLRKKDEKRFIDFER